MYIDCGLRTNKTHIAIGLTFLTSFSFITCNQAKCKNNDRNTYIVTYTYTYVYIAYSIYVYIYTEIFEHQHESPNYLFFRFTV